jgi:hypothetical protein
MLGSAAQLRLDPMSDPKAEVAKSLAEMLGVLDEKFKNSPEWRAYRALQRAYAAMDTSPPRPQAAERGNGADDSLSNSYADIGLRAMGKLGRPIPTLEAIQLIRSVRDLPGDEERAKNIVSSAFSHDERIASVSWNGGRAWWHANRTGPAGH